MHASHPKRTSQAVAVVVAILALAVAGCGSSGPSASSPSTGGGSSSPSTGGGSSSPDPSPVPSTGGEVTLTFLTASEPNFIKASEALVADFEAQNPGIRIKTDALVSTGAGDDNAIKTKLATDTMSDIFAYNPGAALSPLVPEKTLVDLTGSPMLDNVVPTFLSTVTVDDRVYGVPVATGMGGGILYNKAVYADLGLKVPLTWNEFMANNAKIKAAGKAAVIETFGDAWTAQILILSNFYNLQAAQPSFVKDYTENKAHYADDPIARIGFDYLQQIFESGYANKDFASAKLDDGIKMLATGEGVHYPMLTFAVATLKANYPDNVKDVGFFATPGTDPALNGLTTWMPKALYINKKVTDPNKLAAAKAFLAFVASSAGCDSQTKAVGATGPYMVKGCELGSDVPPAISDMLPYLENGNNSPALEFLTPLNGPNLDVISVAVGSGITSPQDGAAQFDGEIKKQAQQLGLSGW